MRLSSIFILVAAFVPVIVLPAAVTYHRLGQPPPTYNKEAEDFCYEDDDETCGPIYWSGFCNFGNNVEQSPIVIPTAISNSTSAAKAIEFSKEYFTLQNSFYILNNGHTIQLSLPNEVMKAPQITYDRDLGLGSYIFYQMHFHWGPNNTVGSEHVFDGTGSSPMEIHLVHFSTKYKNFNEALASDDRFAISVIGIMVSVSSADNLLLAPIVESVKNVSSYSQIGQSVEINAEMRLIDFIPKNLDFYSYDGSLTTPPCTEKVKWTFLQDHIELSAKQINEFREVIDTHGRKLIKNYRPLQNIGNRQIRFYVAKDQRT